MLPNRVENAMGDRARCKQARDAYLARYPRGVHVTVVNARCGGS
jgi:hypothetical protein